MNALNLTINHKVVKAYYDAIKDFSTLHLFTEGAVSPAFASLLRYGARHYGWTLAEKSPPQAWQSDTVPRRYVI